MAVVDPVSAGFNFGRSVVGLIQEYVKDPDLAAKLTAEIQQRQIDFSKTLLQTTTTPKTDALVKLLYALRDVVIPMFRPLGSAALTAFGAYLAYNQIPTPEWLDAAMVAAFPGWMASRHVEKAKRVESEKEMARLRQIVSARVAGNSASDGGSILDIEAGG